MSLLFPRSRPTSTPKQRPAMVRKKTREAFQAQTSIKHKQLYQDQPGTGLEVRTSSLLECCPS
jgi:hypothetical protein